MKITFLGAAREVTGSCHRVDCGDRTILIDHGLFQGGADTWRKNRIDAGFDPRAVDAVVVTHAHIDHSGLLPRLVARGYKGPIYATPATCDLLGVMLPDAAYVQEREAASRGSRAAVPLYTVQEAQRVLARLEPLAYERMLDLVPGMRLRLRDAGHILGSAIVELWLTEGGRERKLVFSGDIGQKTRPVVRDPALIGRADVLVLESTYANRLHKSLDATEDELVEVVTATLGRGRGNIVIPAFAVGRTQEILHVLADLVRRERLPRGIVVYVDSPMATRATAITLRHRELIDSETRALIDWERNAGRGALEIRFTESTEESKRLNDVRHGAIIVSASGMCDAGRIKYHLKHNLPRPECAIVFTGFQAAGTLGRRLVDGADVVRLFGAEVPVRARIATIGGLSAHADRDGLLEWLRGFKAPPRETFIVHGEAQTAVGFAELVERELGWRARAPARGDVHLLD